MLIDFFGIELDVDVTPARNGNYLIRSIRSGADDVTNMFTGEAKEQMLERMYETMIDNVTQ